MYLSPDLPDYVKWAEAMGCVGMRVDSADDVVATIEKANEIDDRPVVIDFRTDWREKVYPMGRASPPREEPKRRLLAGVAPIPAADPRDRVGQEARRAGRYVLVFNAAAESTEFVMPDRLAALDTHVVIDTEAADREGRRNKESFRIGAHSSAVLLVTRPMG